MTPTKKDYENLYLGHTPPQSPDVEDAVLGGLLLTKHGRDEVIPMLKPEIFYKENNSVIFAAIQSLYNDGKGIDIITVVHELKRTEKLEQVGGAYYLSELTRPVASTSNIEQYARIITQKFIQREIIRKSGEIFRDAHSDGADAFDLIRQLEVFVTDLNQYIIGKDYEVDYAQLVEDTYREIMEKSEIGFTGIDTGSPKLNALTGGWQNTDLIIMMARPSMGKTTRSTAFAKAALMTGKKCAFFTLEMSAAQIVKKQLSDQSGIFGDKILRSELNEYDKPKLLKAKDSLKALPFYLNDKPAVNPNYIRAVCKERKKKHGLDMVFIDYVQLMKANASTNKGRNREQEISEISSSLKGLAKELKIPIFLLAQMNREVDKRHDKRPILSDLRESGSLEQDADVVFGLYRPSFYYSKNNDPDFKSRDDIDEQSYNRISIVDVLKHRNGKAGVHLEEYFYGELSRYDTGADDTIEKTESNDDPFAF